MMCGIPWFDYKAWKREQEEIIQSIDEIGKIGLNPGSLVPNFR